MKTRRAFVFAMLLTALTGFANAADTVGSGASIPELQAKVAKLEKQLKAYRDTEETVARNLERFGQLDLVAFNNRDWDLIKDIHHEHVKAMGGDGFVSDGMVPAHEWDLKFLFETFPDYRINDHLIKFGSGDWTAGLSSSTGTFTQPMKLRDGTVIQPTGKSFELKAITLARWENGRIMEEYIFWDNAHLFKQLGISE